MSVHVGSTDGDIAAYSLRGVHVGVEGGVVAPVHLQHRLLHLRRLEDPVAEGVNRFKNHVKLFNLGIKEEIVRTKLNKLRGSATLSTPH